MDIIQSFHIARCLSSKVLDIKHSFKGPHYPFCVNLLYVALHCLELGNANDVCYYSGLNSRCAHIIKPMPDGTNRNTATVPATVGGKRINCNREGDDPMRRNVRTRNGLSEMEKSMMQEMPCVSTRGDGPDGRRIEGFLYKYRKGEDVRIVCICHGRFLTPAEFVKHAGGGDVAHPLRHIVVSQFPSVFL